MVYCVAGMTVSMVLRERHDAMLALRRSSHVFEHSNQGIMITDAELRILSVNASFTRITGYSKEEAIGRTPQMLSSGSHEPEFYDNFWAALLVDGAWSGEIWNRRKDGSLYVEWLDICNVKSPLTGLTENYIFLFMDITDRKVDEQNILHQAQHDFLTGLPNRLLFSDRFSQAQAVAHRKHTRFVLMYLDLDRFKQVNDTYGHHVGDQLLKEIAQRLTDTLRATDTVCRLGGDEFVILVPGLEDVDDLPSLCEKMLATLSAPYYIEGNEIHSHASIGFAIYPDNGEELDTLLRAADQAMYQAKEAGGNQLTSAAAQTG
jgi:diguanylate cyclase (GGDEF)-like protein/PAS domain S-box-containing protein